MEQDEAALPPLPSVSSTNSFTNSRKRPRQHQLSSALSTNSSDPAVFSSDDDPALDNYVEGRRKKKYVGSWYQHDPASSDSAFSEGPVMMLGPKPNRTFRRDLDSGVFLGSDGAESDGVPESLDIPTQTKLPQLIVPRISNAEQALRDKITRCLESGLETIDFWQMDLGEVSGETIAPLSNFTYVPKITKDVAFEQKEPELKLYFAQNRLSQLPGALFDLDNLAILSLRNNMLTELPPAIGKLRNLQQLNLAQNRFKTLPIELLDLLRGDHKLQILTLFPNPLLLPDKHFETALDFDESLRESAEFPESTSQDIHSMPRLITRRVGRSQAQTLDSAGNIMSSFRILGDGTTSTLPVDELFEIQRKSSAQVSKEPSSAMERISSRNGRVPSLMEAVMRSCHKTEHLREMAQFVPEELPQLRNLCERAAKQKDEGGLICSQCRRLIVVPAMEWVEWREIRSTSFQSGPGRFRMIPLTIVPDEIYVPFLHRACSLACGPRKQHAGWEFPEGTEGETIGNFLFCPPPPTNAASGSQV